MEKIQKLRNSFSERKKKIFSDADLMKDAYKFSLTYSLLVEEYIKNVLQNNEINFVLLSAGSFSRRELSPFSDIDIMIVLDNSKAVEKEVQAAITALWDCNIEVSHTVRKLSDIKKFLEEDLAAFTQFFETRFILGNKSLHEKFNKKIVAVVKDKALPRLINQYFEDQKLRHKKYGESPKVLEPNVKFTAGGLRDLHLVEWIFALQNRIVFINENETSQTEIFLEYLKEQKLISEKAYHRLKDSYETILMFRNVLHLCSTHKTDRLEFRKQEEIAKKTGFEGDWRKLMKKYFDSANIINRFSKTMLKRFEEILNPPVSNMLEIDIDKDFFRKGSKISIRNDKMLSVSKMIRAFYYRGKYDSVFDQQLRSILIKSIVEIDESSIEQLPPSTYLKKILSLPKNVGRTISSMHVLGLLKILIPEYRDLSGFFQPGVYHSYTADEHSIIALKNTESLLDDEADLGKVFNNLRRKDLLYLSILLHDIAKPISVPGHEIIGADMAVSILETLGFESDEIDFVHFLVQHHLTMEQTAFRRNLNDPSTLDEFAKIFPKRTWLNYLYILTYADLSAVNPAVWTQWKNDLLHELYTKTKQILKERITAEELLDAFNEDEFLYIDEDLREHLESINDPGYQHHYTQEEINSHIEDINSGKKISVNFKESSGFTNVTVITKDIDTLLTRLTGALSINDLNIHGARIFTRNDSIIIDSFNVTDFRSEKPIDQSRYEKIRNDLTLAIDNELYIDREFNKVKNKWWRLEKRIFGSKNKVKIDFEKHEKYTIIDVYAPDKLGLLYQITSTMNELGLKIDLAKISTKADDIVDSFYVLTKNDEKVPTDNYELIRVELTNSIKEIL